MHRHYEGEKPVPERDILLLTFPRRSPNAFYASQLPEALARLKVVAEREGFTTNTLDFDNQFNRPFYRVDELENEVVSDYFRDVMTREYIGQAASMRLTVFQHYMRIVARWVGQVIALKPKWLAISVFSEQSVRATIDFLQMLKKDHPQFKPKIVVGGYAMQAPAYFSQDGSKPMKIGEWMKSLDLIDYFVVGEGEIAFAELLKGNTSYPGINAYNPQQIMDLNTLPIPDYRSFNFANYQFSQGGQYQAPMLSVTGSRGCVRHCEFCDIAAKWPKYRWVEPEVLAREIMSYVIQYGASQFHWSDSIVNASPPHLERILDMLIAFEDHTKTRSYHTGQFIIREMDQMPDRMWGKLHAAGFRRLIFGIESGSRRTRWDMKKKFSNEAIHATMDKCRDHGIRVQNLLIVGYPSETWEDFLETARLIYRYRPHWEYDVDWGLSAFGMEKDWDESDLNRHPERYDIEFDPILGWKNAHMSYYLAVKRTQALYELMRHCEYGVYPEWLRENEEEIIYIEGQLMASGREKEIVNPINILVQEL
jgi:radical SAM superfamily enzyme YgiQ (UPF0313 family)